jgi:hypothetical protein
MFGGASGQTPGAIYELISRGVKDKYFFAELEEGAFTPFSNQYAMTARYLTETKTTIAAGEPAFGKTIEFELDRYGDILTDMCLQIQLPPGPTYPAAAGFWLLRKIEILQGQMTVLETSGEALYLLSGVKRRGCAADLVRQLGDASEETMRVKIPFPGCQSDREGSFPLCAVPNKTYKIRVTLRKFSGAGAGQPSVTLETTQAYLLREARDEIVRAVKEGDGLKIPFLSHYEQAFSLKPGASAQYLIDNVYNLCEGLYMYAKPDTDAATFTDISGGAIREIGFTVAGNSREFIMGSDMWGDVMTHAKMMSSAPVDGVFSMNWSLGDVHRAVSQDPTRRRPEGGVNFTEANKPTLYVTAGMGVTRGGDPYKLHVIGEAWKIYNIQGGGYARVL